MNQEQRGLFRRKVWRVLRSPLVWFSAVVGSGLAFLGWLTGSPTGVIGLTGLGFLSAATLAAILRWTAGGRKLTQDALEDLLRGEYREHASYLKRLRRRMRRDRDPRTSNMVKQLKAVYDRLWSLIPDASGDEQVTRSAAAVHSQVRELYDSCLKLLERSLELWEGSRKMSTDEARSKLLNSRSELLNQVEQSIAYLDASLDELQTAALQQDYGLTEVNSRLQQELDQGLEVARRVEERMEQLENDLRIEERA